MDETGPLGRSDLVRWTTAGMLLWLITQTTCNCVNLVCNLRTLERAQECHWLQVVIVRRRGPDTDFLHFLDALEVFQAVCAACHRVTAPDCGVWPVNDPTFTQQLPRLAHTPPKLRN
jgi:hypothetical protein